MKIIKVTHYRCAEYDKCEYYVAPDAMTVEEISKVLEKAQEAYLVALAAWEALLPKPAFPGTNISDFPEEITIAEAKRRVAEAMRCREEIETKRRAIELSFDSVLSKLNIIVVRSVHVSEDLEFTVDWGHRHGMQLDY